MKTRSQGGSSHSPRWLLDRSDPWWESWIPCVVSSRPVGLEFAPHFVTERLAPHGFLSSRPTGWTGSQAPSWTRRGDRERMLDDSQTPRRFRREAKPARDGLREWPLLDAKT